MNRERLGCVLTRTIPGRLVGLLTEKCYAISSDCDVAVCSLEYLHTRLISAHWEWTQSCLAPVQMKVMVRKESPFASSWDLPKPTLYVSTRADSPMTKTLYYLPKLSMN